MAIVTKARILDPRDLVLVWLDDPSVGGDAEARAAYEKDGEIAHLALDGRETKFHARLLGGREFQLVREAGHRYPGEGEWLSRSLAMWARAFELGVKRVSGWAGADGVLRDLPRAQWLSELPGEARDDVGRMIFNLSVQTTTTPPEDSIPLPSPPAP